jgi:pimeloyl-ACP methyl ester carboxylesterase/DNA-binding winged helix-turn-helix (wHTH) protein/class 3 adenylate cyclase
MNTAPLSSEMAPNRRVPFNGLPKLSTGRALSVAAKAQVEPVYEFGSYRLDPAGRLLLKNGEKVTITPKAFDILVALIENAGRVLGKEELMQIIWPDTFVEQANLPVTISLVRKALGERPDGGQYIETMPRRGYRFAAPVRDVSDLSPDVDESSGYAGADHKSDEGPPAMHDVSREELSAAGPSASFTRSAPETRYAKSGDVNIAYQVIGNGPLDLVFVMGWVSHLEYFWEEPSFARFLSRLASFSRLILFDKRGTGLSDPVPINKLPTLEERMDDVRAVMNAVGSKRAVLVGVSEGGPLCSMFAATYPEMTSALVMIGTYAKRIWDMDYPWAPTRAEREKFCEEIQQHWGGPMGLEERAPSKAGDPHFRNWWATYLRMGASPGAALALTQMNAEIDVRHVLPSVRVPTLVLHRTDDRCLKVEEGRYVAERIPGAKFVEVSGVDHLPFVGDQDSLIDEIEEFLTGERQHMGRDRVLATVMVAHINDLAVKDGLEGQHTDFVDRLQAHVRKEIELFHGCLIEMSGSRVVASFDGPARAIRCASVINEVARRLGRRIKVGLHTGECYQAGDKVRGTAVDIGTQLAFKAATAEVLVSRTVKDLVAGSGFTFLGRGVHSFDGVLEEWELFAVRRSI